MLLEHFPKEIINIFLVNPEIILLRIKPEIDTMIIANSCNFFNNFFTQIFVGRVCDWDGVLPLLHPLHLSPHAALHFCLLLTTFSIRSVEFVNRLRR